jgi:L-glutamine:2-deoxy-scyllo-inosose/3-amino-2,3-dideoxy-scyllo-inosose aminotransferase
MSTLAINGGPSVRPPGTRWPAWPVAGPRERELLDQVLATGKWAYNGPMETEFSRAFADYQDCAYGFCVSSGADALELAVEALEIGPGDEVIVPGFTWISTASAAITAGADVVFVDVDPGTYQIDPTRIEEAITARTHAIILAHLYSRLADMDAILDLARRHHLRVIEDCAQAVGGVWNGRKTGSMGDIGCFSFQKGKALTCGEGGFISTNSAHLADRIYSLKDNGRPRHPASAGTVLGHNSRITEFQAAVLLAQFDSLDDQVKHRASNAAHLDSQLSQIPGIRTLRRDPRIGVQSHYSWICQFDTGEFSGTEPETFRAALRAEGIPADSTYGPVYRTAPWAVVDPSRWRVVSGTVTERVTSEIVNLHQPVLLASRSDMDDIASAIGKLRENRAELASIRPPADPQAPQAALAGFR